MEYKSTRTSLVYMFFTYIPMLCVSEAFLRAQEVPDMPYPGNGDTLVAVNAQARAWTPETLYRKHRTQGFMSVLSSVKFIICLRFMKIWLTPTTQCINHMLCLHTFQDNSFGALNAKHRLDDKPSGLNTLAKSLTWHIDTPGDDSGHQRFGCIKLKWSHYDRNQQILDLVPSEPCQIYPDLQR